MEDGREAREAAVRAAVTRAARAYFAERRGRIDAFVAEHYSLAGALRLHRRALGWDLARAPANLLLAPVALLGRVAAGAARRAGRPETADRLARAAPYFETAVAREVRRLIAVELLGLPAEAGEHDALAEAIARDAGVAEALGGGLEAEARRRLAQALADYASVRAPAAEITTALATMGAGAAALSQITPGALTLGPAAAAALAQSAAVAAFPLGATAGGVWYGLFPAQASAGLVAATTAGVLGAAAAASAFAGVIADPVQKALGLHQRRLRRLIDALEAEFTSGEGAGFAAREHYVARLLDVGDAALAALRVIRG